MLLFRLPHSMLLLCLSGQCLGWLLLALRPLAVQPQTGALPIIKAMYTAEAPALDGALLEPCWQQATTISEFTQRELVEGDPASERTRVAAVFDDNALYFGIWCYDSEPQAIVAKEMKRDFSYRADDNFKIILDTYHDRRNGYRFVINPNGARNDALISNEGGQVNDDWNGVWDAAARVTEEGWFAEIEIPFSTLKYRDSDGTWGVNFEREIIRKKEQVRWAGWSRNFRFEQLSQAGELSGLRDIKSKRLLELRPYLTGGFENAPAVPAAGVHHTGMDVNYLMTSNLKLNLTAFTDFAQVESDRAQINLSRFSLFFPEKRDFFLEGRDAFSFDLGRRVIPFYSRQIGIQDGREIPILGGGRLIGKAGSLGIGALSMQTAAEDSVPSTNYSVIRLRQELLAQSNAGVIVVAKNSAGRSNYVYGADASWVSSRFLGDRTLAAGGAIVRSRTRGRPAGQDYAYRLYASFSSDHLEFDSAFDGVRTNFNPETGFLRRSNFRHFYAEMQLNPRPHFLPFIRQMELKPVDVDYYWNDQTGSLESFNAEWRPLGFRTKSGEQFEYNIQREFDAPAEAFEIADNALIPAGRYWFTQHEIQAETYRGRRISLSSEIGFGDFYTGKRVRADAGLRINVNRHLNVDADYSWNRLRLGQNQFSTHEVGGRAEYAFSTKLNTSVMGQWNNEDDEILLNLRLHWIPVIGSDFYVAVNQLITTREAKFTWDRTALLSKIVWRFAP